MYSAIRVYSIAIGVSLALGATCTPPPDTDATVVGSAAFELGRWQRNSLDCGRSVQDCADWVHFDVPGRGTLRLDLAKVEDEQPVPEFELVLGEPSGRPIESKPSAGQSRIRMTKKVKRGNYTAAIRLAEQETGRMDYEFRISFTPKPVPVAVPQFDRVRTAVLEIESRPGGGEAVLLDRGSSSGIRAGQRGRLIEGGSKIADLEILDVYPEGSRALVRGSLGAAITPSTVAEVDVPR